MTPYEILGVALGASDEEIRRAYKARARECHPDLGGDAETFKALRDAYDLLLDPERRAALDAGGTGGLAETLGDLFRSIFDGGSSEQSQGAAFARLADAVEEAVGAAQDASDLTTVLRDVGAQGVRALREAPEDEDPETTLVRAGLYAFGDWCRGGGGRSPFEDDGRETRSGKRRRASAGRER